MSWAAVHRAAMVSPYDGLAYTRARGFTSQTVRQVVHLHRGGSQMRLHLSNRYGRTPLRIGELRIAVHLGGGKVADGTAVTFGGTKDFSVPSGGELVTDPINLAVDDDSELAISAYVVQDTGPATNHPEALQTGYLAEGNVTALNEIETVEEITSLYWLSGIDAFGARRDEPVIVAFGDSLTDGSGTSMDLNQRYPDHLSRRLGVPVLNQGIGGNRLLRDGFGEAGLARFQRHVLDVPGVTHVIIELGINDIGLAFMLGQPKPRAADLIDGLALLLRQARTAGILPIVATLPPFEGCSFPGYWTEKGQRIRDEVNAWIRANCPDVMDIGVALADPSHPSRYNKNLDSGDGLHPNDAGTLAMSNAFLVFK